MPLTFPDQDNGELREQAVREWMERIGTAHRRAVDATADRVRATYRPSADFLAASATDHEASKAWIGVLVAVFADIADTLEEAGVQAVHDRGDAA